MATTLETVCIPHRFALAKGRRPHKLDPMQLKRIVLHTQLPGGYNWYRPKSKKVQGKQTNKTGWWTMR